MKLHLGKMKTKELAQWFSISDQSFRNSKKRKLEELKLYCDFEEVYGGVYVKEIYDEENGLEYVKGNSKSYELVKSSFSEEWNSDGIDTCSNVAIKIIDKHKNELSIADSTTYNYVLRARNELYGVPFISLGELGSCVYLWCKKEMLDDGTIVYTQFSDEEDKIRKDLMKKMFSTDVDKEVFIAEMVQQGEITKEEAYDKLCELKNLNKAGYTGFLKALKEAIGSDVSKATLLYKEDDKIEFEESNLITG